MALPLFIHEREAHQDLKKVLGSFTGRLPRVCIHCFTGDREELVHYVKEGYYIGITGYVAKKKRGSNLRAMITEGLLPIHRLMIETDAPYMCPDDRRCKSYHRKNEPCTLPVTAQVLASCYGMEYDAFCKATTANAATFFSLPEMKLDCRQHHHHQQQQNHHHTGGLTHSPLALLLLLLLLLTLTLPPPLLLPLHLRVQMTLAIRKQARSWTTLNSNA
mmetsp:Transcript_18597/g.37606  ORF Transcript_18597/g.37606 Transcript_18597/m.37606 type:complete len:218 (+) Transcript_18597:62-715(+)